MHDSLQIFRRPRLGRTVFAVAGAGVLTVTALAPSAVGSTPAVDAAAATAHTVVVTGLDNPRQLVTAPGGKRLIVAQAGHGATGCESEEGCIGRTGKVSLITRGNAVRDVMTGVLSQAGADGTFAVGVDGAGKRAGGAYFGIVTEAPPDLVPEGLPGWQAGKLLKANKPLGKKRVVADVARFEERNDPDGEGVESNPYSVLVLKNRVLVADAAGDYIAQVDNKGKVSVWAVMPEYGKKVDAVPTVITKGRDGFIYVGELHSEQPKAAKVHRFSRDGKLLRSWKGFTTVTGLAVKANGTLYVSELFGGSCGFDRIPECFPGRVVRVLPNGKRKAVDVPFPAGVALRNGKPFVAAFSVAPATGAFGNPEWSGQIWRLNRL